MSRKRSLAAVLLCALAPGARAGPPSPSDLARGKAVYDSVCFACHMANGQGIPATFPPLAGSDYLKADKDRAIRIAIKGMSGPITVNGKTYDAPMPAQPFTDTQVSDVVTYVMNAWGNDDGCVSPDDAKRVREKKD